MHAYGCRVIQRILEHCIDEQKQVILEETKDSFSVLIQVNLAGFFFVCVFVFLQLGPAVQACFATAQHQSEYQIADMI